jgi:serine/threonine protein kinase
MTEPDTPPGDAELLEDVLAAADRRGAGACPDAAALVRFLESPAPGAGGSPVEAHVARCPVCRRLVAAVVAALPDEDAVPALDEDQATEGLPRRFGAYELRRRLGRGGMGVVYEAVHDARGRPEALKTLDGPADTVEADRLEREVKVLASISHEHVVPLYDAGRIEGRLYFTMPLLPGPSLARVLEEAKAAGDAPEGPNALAALARVGGRAEPGTPSEAWARRAAGALVGVADALATVHAAGLVHRDVKPSNLLLDARGRLVLSDFGLARVDASTLTASGLPVGTPAYMAPEQLATGTGEVDGRADVYGLGATLYEMLTLRRPHEGKTVVETLSNALRRRPRPVRELAPSVPADVATVVERCLERRPDDRYATAAALRDDLDAVAAGRPVATRPVPASRRVLRAMRSQALPIAVAAAVLVALGAFLATRPGRLTVRSLPTASLLVDGAPTGTTPLVEASFAAGAHEVTLRRDGFVETRRRVSLGRGDSLELDVMLRAVDPADPATVALVEREAGVERTEVAVEPLRTTPTPVGPTPLSPRGLVRAAPSEVAVWSDDVAEGVSVRIEREGEPREVVLDLPPRTVFRRTAVAVPPESRARIGPGKYRLVAVAKGMTTDASFAVLEREDAAGIDRAVAKATAAAEKDDPVAAFVRADLYLHHGLVEDALAEARRLKGVLGDRKEVARLGVAACTKAGLVGVGPWFDWAEAYLKAER